MDTFDRQRIRNAIEKLAHERWEQLNDIGMHLVSAEVADIAMQVLDDAGVFDEQCTATTGRSVVARCGFSKGHDNAHKADMGGGSISWHGETAGSQS